MVDGSVFASVLEKVGEVVRGEAGRDEKLGAICRLLADRIPYYDWVGFYMADFNDEVLLLGPFVGEPTEHARIPFGQGVCGQVARDGTPLIVQDVSRETNYLSCSPLVRSEIVVPVFKDGRAVAQIDIDSHTPAAFSVGDRAFLTGVCEAVSSLF